MDGRNSSLVFFFAVFAIFMLSIFLLNQPCSVYPYILLYHDNHTRNSISQVYASITRISVDSR